MSDFTDKVQNPDAAARRRRMRRRYAKRRLSKVFAGSAVVFILAVAVTPDAPTYSGLPTGPSHGMTGQTATGPRANTLPINPIWRPAGEVLKRTKIAVASTPAFLLDPKERAGGEVGGRWRRINAYSAKYRIKTDLARRIYDAANKAGIEPELAFRLVRVESVFDTRAVSRAGALGLTQLMLGTAREFEPKVTREQLLDPDVNLRIGFAYLRGLIREYKGDLKLALLVYNRGPVAVQRSLSMGLSPANGYESIITKGYRGRGVVD